MKKPAVLGLIMARGGSKGIPKKNIALCGGEPLLTYTITAAQHSSSIDRLLLTTDDEEIAATGRAAGLQVPFLRPKELAEDNTLDLPVVQHALEWLKENESYVPDIVVHLRPTTPLKKSSDIDKGVQLLLENKEAHSVRSVCEPQVTPFKMYRYEESTSPFLQPLLKNDYPEVYEKYPEPFNMPRQKLPPLWRHSGYIDIVRTSTIENGSISGTKILPLFFEKWRDIDIDSPRDLFYASYIIENLRKEGKVIWK